MEIVLNSDVEFQKVNLYFQDESRFGLLTRNGKMLTAKGVKPICKFQHVFQSSYLYGAFLPIDGSSLLMELPQCNGENFQLFLNEMSQQNPEEYKIMVLDNGAFHKAKTLKVPKNIALMFLPAYSPELNPAEKMWAIIKRKFSNVFCETLEDISAFLDSAETRFTNESIKKTCSYSYIFNNLQWTNSSL